MVLNFSFQGSEAAAATTVKLKLKRRKLSHTNIIEFRADRPFIFMIREMQNNVNLFYGRFLSSNTTV